MIVGIIPAKPGTADILSPERYSQFMAVIRIDFLPALEIRRFGIEDQSIEIEKKGFSHGDYVASPMR